MDSVSLYLLILAGVVIPPSLLVAYLARREWEREAAEDKRSRPMAE